MNRTFHQALGGCGITVRVFPLVGEHAPPMAESTLLLPLEERARADRFVFPEHRARWIRCRATVRKLLAARLGVDAGDLSFNQEPGSKPRVKGVEFNYSHSGHWGALVVSDSKPAGVDIEELRTDFPFLEVAGDYFTDYEIPALRACSAAELPRLFYRQWTAKEAVMKATGLGMSLEPVGLETLFTDDTGGSVLRRDTGQVYPVRTWWLEDAVCTAAVIPEG